jgi:hypothetical protein
MISVCPPAAGTINGVQPSLLPEPEQFAPCIINTFTPSKWPLSPATIKAIDPFFITV